MSLISEVVRIITRQPPAKIDLDTLNEIEMSLITGKIDDAFDLIDWKIENSQSEFAHNYLRMSKVKLMAEQQIEEGYEEILAYDGEHPVLQILKVFQEAYLKFRQVEISEALKLIEIDDELKALNFIYNDHYIRLKAQIYALKAKLYNRTGKFTEAIELIKEVMEIYRKMGEEDLLANPLNDLGISYTQLGKNDDAINAWTQALKIYEKNGNEVRVLKLYSNMGLLNQNRGELTDALNNYKKSLEISENFNDIKTTSYLLQNMGIVYQDLGDLDKSMENFDKAISNFDKLGADALKAISMMTQGVNYYHLGDMDQALSTFKKARNSMETNSDMKNLGSLYNAMAAAYQSKGFSKKAIDLVNKSIEILTEIGNKDGLLHSYQTAIDVSVESNNLQEAKSYLEDFKILVEEAANEYSEKMYQMSQATVDIQSERLVPRARAFMALEKLTKDEKLGIQTKIKAYLKLADILTEELKMSSSEEAFSELKELVEQLDKNITSSEEGLVQIPHLIDILVLKSKISRIDLNFEEARNRLNEAMQHAKKAKMKERQNLIKSEQDSIEEQMKRYKGVVDSNATLYQRLQESQIENYLSRAEGILKK